MNTHRFIQYLKYRRKAKGRHGVHSPFVYQFIEQCLRQKDGRPLSERLSRYFQDWEITQLRPEHPESWPGEVQAVLSAGHNQLLVLVPEIHQTLQKSTSWAALCQLPDISYSIDLFHWGLLFVHTDFKEQQHFILRH